MKIEQITGQPTLAAARFSLRPVRDTDAPLIAKFANDRRVAQMTASIPFPLSEDQAAEFVKRSVSVDRTEDVWALDGGAFGGEGFLGLIALKSMDRGQSEVGYWVAPEFWNRGYATEALAAVLMANPHDNKSVVASVFQDNPTSARILSSAGFANLGEAESFCLARGTHVPTWTYLKTL